MENIIAVKLLGGKATSAELDPLFLSSGNTL